MHPIRLGVIGLGLIWLRTHKAIVTSMPETFELVAFCDPNEQRRQETAADFPNATVVADAHDLLQLPQVEAVLVLTPIPLNAPTALAAIQTGKDVFMEKPIARSVDEGQALVAAARQAQRRLVVLEQNAYRSADRRIAELIRSGAIGELAVWDRVQHDEPDRAPGPLRYASTEWRKIADFPLGTLFDGGIHLIAGLSTVFGAPEAVCASGKQLRPEYGEFDQVSILFQYANRVSGLLSQSSYLPPSQNHFHIYGSTGIITVEPRQLIVETPDAPVQVIDLAPENPYRAMWAALAQAVHDNSRLFYTAEKALRDVAILEAVDQSIHRGERTAVVVPTSGV